MDVARVVAMVLVVLDHAVINVAVLAEQDTAQVEWWFAEALLAVSRLAVPVFLMVSGALLLDPAKDEPLRDFARRRLQRVGVPLVVWALAYLTFRRDVLDEQLSGDQAMRDFFAGNPYYHLYYLYIALGLYALTPFLRRLIAVTDRRWLVLLCAMAFGLGVVDQFLRTVLHTGSTNGITMFVDYVGFYLAGWLLRDATQWRLARIAAPVVVGSLVLVVLVAWAVIELGQGQHWFYSATYLSPAVIAASLALYVLVQRVRPAASAATALRRVSDLSLGTYLVHPMLLDLFRDDRTMPAGLDGLLMWVVGLTVAGVLTAMAVTFVARLIPLVRRVF